MPTISLRRLSDKTAAKYEQAERDGTITERQKRALWGHRNITRFVEAAHERVVEESKQRKNTDDHE